MRSTKMTVTTLRSSGGGAPTGYPQLGQNRASSGSGSPHRSHVGLPTAAVYGGGADATPRRRGSPQGPRRPKRVAVRIDERDRERDELTPRSDLDVGRELGEASLAERPGRHVRVLARLTARAEKD